MSSGAAPPAHMSTLASILSGQFLLMTGLDEASLLAGIVRNVTPAGACTVDLVGGRSGLLSLEDQYDPESQALPAGMLTKSLLKVGDLVVVGRTCKGRKRRADQLTLRPSVLHHAISWVAAPVKNQILLVTITAVEDHGYQCSLGHASRKHGIKLFIKKSSASYELGQVVPVAVDAVKKDSKIIVCRDEDWSSRYISVNVRTDVTKLVPGQLLECRTAEIKYLEEDDRSVMYDDDGLPHKKRQKIMTPSGGPAKLELQKFVDDDIRTLGVHISGMALATVPAFHRHQAELCRRYLAGEFPSTTKLPTFPYVGEDATACVGTTVPSYTDYRDAPFLGRLIACDPASKTVMVSLVPTWVHWSFPLSLQEDIDSRGGSVIENLTVVCKLPKSLVLINGLKYSDEESQKKPQFAHVWRCTMDEYTSNSLIWQNQKPGSEHRQGKCMIVNIPDFAAYITVKAATIENSPILTMHDLKVGQLVEGTVRKVGDEFALLRVGPHVTCRLHRDNIRNVAVKKPTQFQVDEVVKARVLFVNRVLQRADLTVKPVHMEMSEEDVETQIEFSARPRIDVIMDLVVQKHVTNGVILKGFGNAAAFLYNLDIMRNSTDHKEMSEEVAKEIRSAKRFQPGAVVKVRIIRVTANKIPAASLDLTTPIQDLALTPRKDPSESKLNFDDIKVGVVLPAVVTNVTNSGVFVQFENSRLSALARYAEALEEGETEASFVRGDNVLTKVLSVDPELRRVTVGLKSSYFTDLMAEPEDGEEAMEDAASVVEEEAAEPVEIQESDDGDSVQAVDSDDETVASDAESDTPNVEVVSASEAESEPEVVSDEESEEDDEPSAEHTTERDVASESESEVEQVEEVDPITAGSGDDAEGDAEAQRHIALVAGGETLADLEKAVMCDGEDPLVWIRLMAYWAEQDDMEKMMATVYRAMNVIGLEERTKREDIWKAAINIVLEISDAELRAQVITEACSYNERSEMYQHLITTYIDHPELWSELDKLEKVILKTQRCLGVWLKWLDYLYLKGSGQRRGGLVVVRSEKRVKDRRAIDSAIRRAETILESARDRITLTVHMAKLEYELGSHELGRSKLLELVEQKPKRADVWNVLLDAQVKNTENKSDLIMTRQLFQRAVKALQKVAKVKAICGKWLEFEAAHGSAATVRACEEAIQSLVSTSS